MNSRLNLILGVLSWQGTAKFKEFSQKLSVHFVECSPALRKLQRETLKCVPKGEEDPNSDSGSEQISQISGASVNWHFDLEQVPRGGTDLLHFR